MWSGPRNGRCTCGETCCDGWPGLFMELLERALSLHETGLTSQAHYLPCAHAPLSASHTRTVQSAPHVTMWRPSGEKAP